MQSKLASPLPVFPGTADTLVVDSLYSFPPSYRWALVQTQPAQDKGGSPTSVTLTQGNGQMTDAQWNAWGANVTDDNAYVLSCVAKNLNLSLAS